MGRKIPGRKHKGVRDPDKQRLVKFNSLKEKINAPPLNSDEQHVPKSLSRIIELKEKVKDGTISAKRKRKHKRKLAPVTSHPRGVKQHYDKRGNALKPTPVFTQGSGETDRHFMFRVNRICDSVIQEAAFEDKYRVDIKRNALTGEVEGVQKRKKDELELLMKQARKDKKEKGKKKKKKSGTVERLTKSQKKQVKLKEKKEQREYLKVDEFKDYEDEIKFGDVVHEPPTLSVPRKVSSQTSKPGERDLLLKSLVGNEKSVKVDSKPLKVHDKVTKTAKNVIDKKGKRKNLPHAVRRQLDAQQKEIVNAYKLLKAKKYVEK